MSRTDLPGLPPGSARIGPGIRGKRKKPLPAKPKKGKGEPGSIKRRRRGAAEGERICPRCFFPLHARRGYTYCPTGCPESGARP